MFFTESIVLDAAIITTFCAIFSFYRVFMRLPSNSPQIDYLNPYPPMDYPIENQVPVESSDSFETNGLSTFVCSKASGSENLDFFEVKQISSGVVAFCVGDVSGKGLAASFCQSACVSSLKLASSITVDPVSVISEVNRSLADRGLSGHYATLVYGTLEIASGRLRLVSAGHPLPIRISRDDELEFLDCKPCLPVGIVADYRYTANEYRLAPGDTLVLYSDGITEARDGQRDFFGEKRLAKTVQRFHSCLPRRLVGHLFDYIQTFSVSRRDDQTILALHYSGVQSPFATNNLNQAAA